MKLTQIATDLFQPLRNAEEHSSLSISPDELDLLSISLLILFFVARTIKFALGLGNEFKPLKARVNSPSKQDDEQDQSFSLPDLSLSMPLRLDAATTFRYFTKAVEPLEESEVTLAANNAQLCLCLSALTEPAMLLLLAKRGCPIRPLGAVNVRNRFELLRPELCRLLFDNTKSASTIPSLSITARFPRPARKVRRGLEIDLEVTLLAGRSESVPGQPPTRRLSGAEFEHVPIFRQEFTMLQFMTFKSKHTRLTPGKISPNHRLPSLEKDTQTIYATMPTSAPHAWAVICKDYNPIHFSSVLAKLLGQPGQLAHGNHAAGVCVQAMSKAAHVEASGLTPANRLVLEKLENREYGEDGWWMEVRFRRPIVLPARLRLDVYITADGFDIVNDKSGKVGVEVSVGSM